jgi:hypothetical protein
VARDVRLASAGRDVRTAARTGARRRCADAGGGALTPGAVTRLTPGAVTRLTPGAVR